MKILITGSNGLLGQKLLHKLRIDNSVELIATSRGDNRVSEQSNYKYIDLDITDENAVSKIILEQNPDVVINTAAMTNVDLCEAEKDNCDALNVSAVQFLA
ncbi:MAG: sugar nucleotide-binding protein, partial [Flavobacteriales bacterium]|nr:sugar nucleotide-binding protein [Flavobacteriales bacterium]